MILGCFGIIHDIGANYPRFGARTTGLILPVLYISLLFAGFSTVFGFVLVFGSLLAGRSGPAEPAVDGETRRLLSRLHPIHTSLPT